MGGDLDRPGVDPVDIMACQQAEHHGRRVGIASAHRVGNSDCLPFAVTELPVNEQHRPLG